MKLSANQIHEYNERGFLIIPDSFSTAELDQMRSELVRVSAQDCPGINREDSGDLRSLYRVHDPDSPTVPPTFEKYVTMPRVLQPARQLLDDDQLYIFQTKCNLKQPLRGGIYQWHQDFGHWRNDGIPSPRMVTSLVMLDAATELSGCLYFLPGSHKAGVLEPKSVALTASMNIWAIPDEDLLTFMMKSADPVAITGAPGTSVFFHPNILHASGHNLSRHRRWHVFTVYNRISNRQTAVPNPRPEWAVATKFDRIEMTDDSLLDQRRKAA